MANDFTTRLSIPYANDPTDAFTIRQDIEDIVTLLDNAAMYEQGVLGSLPAGASKPNGYWYADTASGGHIYVNVGSGAGRAYRRIPALDSSNHLALPATLAAAGTWLSVGSTSGASVTSFDTRAALFYANYNVVTDRLRDTAAAGWRVFMDGGFATDTLRIQRAAPTAAAPTWVTVATFDANGLAIVGDITASDDLTVTDDASVGGDLTVAGTITQTGSRGKSIIATEESRTNVAYGTLTTPDQVTGIVVPPDGVLCISFRALVKNSAAGAGTVAIFVGANQLKIPTGGGAPVVTERVAGATTTDYGWIHTTPASASGFSLVDSAGDATSVTTGMFAAQHVEVEVAPGTYTVSVQYKASSGSITAKERKLWVEARGY